MNSTGRSHSSTGHRPAAATAAAARLLANHDRFQDLSLPRVIVALNPREQQELRNRREVQELQDLRVLQEQQVRVQPLTRNFSRGPTQGQTDLIEITIDDNISINKLARAASMLSELEVKMECGSDWELDDIVNIETCLRNIIINANKQRDLLSVIQKRVRLVPSSQPLGQKVLQQILSKILSPYRLVCKTAAKMSYQPSPPPPPPSSDTIASQPTVPMSFLPVQLPPRDSVPAGERQRPQSALELAGRLSQLK